MVKQLNPTLIDSDAIKALAARGVPAPVVEIDATEAEITWAAASMIERMHPILQAVAAAKGVTDAELDAMFGWGG